LAKTAHPFCQTEDVLVDTHGNIYITDKQWGVFVLRYTGPGQPKPTAKLGMLGAPAYFAPQEISDGCENKNSTVRIGLNCGKCLRCDDL
jgi:hypothetical protein